ncbi:MAG: hypothetical protein ACOYJ1_10220 [Peptococcales bacterium]|jgi:hypothetical protein
MISKIIITEQLDTQLKNVLMELQKEHREKVEGIYDLYDGLYATGKCESYSLDRIYYVAYTLATKGIDFIVNERKG